MQKIRTFLITLAFFGLSANVAFASTAQELRNQINANTHGGSGTLTAGGTGNTVNVTGTVTGATNQLSLNIDAGVTVNWRANYSGSNSNRLVHFNGSGSFNVDASGARIQNSHADGVALYKQGTVAFSISAGTITTTSGTALRNASSGTANITGGTISATGAGGRAIYASISQTVTTISGGTVSATTGNAIYNANAGTVTISGGTVSATTGEAVYNNGSGTVNITNGTVTATTGVAVWNQAGGTINISDGYVSGTGTGGRGIRNETTGAINISGGWVYSSTWVAVVNAQTGKITVSGSALVASGITDVNYGTIYNFDYGTETATRIEITGGSVQNNAGGNAIRNNSTGALVISGEGSVRSSTGVAVRNSNSGTVNISGNATVYAFDNGGRAIYNTSTGAINISGGTVSAADNIAVDNGFTGKVTISGGTVTSGITNTAYATVYSHITTGNAATTRIEITGGIVRNTGVNGFAVKNISDGEVIIRGGTVEATEENGIAAINHAGGTLTIRGDNTIVRATANGGTAVLNWGNGIANISGGTISSTTFRAIWNQAAGAINISNGSVLSINYIGVDNLSTGNVTITGGTIRSVNAIAVCNNANGKITISGGTMTAGTTNVNNATIYAHNASTATTTRIEITGGTISNTESGNAVLNASAGAIEISGGIILAKNGYALNKSGSGTLTINNNAKLFAYGTTDTDVINGAYTMSGNAIIAAWNSAAGTNTYEESTNTHIYKLPASASASWGKQGTASGISVFNGTNTGFIPIEGVAVVPPQPFEGLGTELNPYLISTPQQLKQLSDLVNVGNVNFNNKYYKLMNDIDLSNYQEGEGWPPIGDANNENENIRFKGHFDGNQKKITGLKIRNTTFESVGLFGFVENGTIKNLGIENADIVASTDYEFTALGCVAGAIKNGKISNCYSTGKIIASVLGYNFTGGIVGSSENSEIENCFSNASVSGFTSEELSLSVSYVGGIAGLIQWNSKVLNCYSTGEINAVALFRASAGGIGGCITTNSTISNCAALNPVIYSTALGSGVFGRVVGFIASGTNTLLRNTGFEEMLNPEGYAVWENTGLTNIDGEDISIQMIHEDGTLGNRFTSPNWTTQNGKLPGLFGNTVEMPFHLVDGIPFAGDGTEGNPYEINTHGELYFLASWVNKGNGNDTKNVFYKLMNNLDLSSYSNWLPIGLPISETDFTRAFQGNFNGNGKVIKNVTINRLDDYVGLFGMVYGATIENLGVENCKISGENHVGGLAGRVGFNSSVSNCYVTGIVNGATCVGGLAGTNWESNIKNCYSTATVNGRAHFVGNVGGLVGYNSLNSEIFNCYATGNVYAYRNRVGGLVGYNQGSSKIVNCIAANEVVTTTYNFSIAEIDRITGFNEGVLLFNYANQNMEVKADGYDITIDNGTTTTSGEDKTMYELERSNFYLTGANWLNSQIWNILPPDGVWKKCIDDGLPYLRWQGGDCEELVSIEQLQITNYELRVFPNPTDGQLRITNYELKEIGVIEIYDVAGRIVPSCLRAFAPSCNEIVLDISHLPAGVYFLRAGNEMVKVVKK